MKLNLKNILWGIIAVLILIGIFILSFTLKNEKSIDKEDIKETSQDFCNIKDDCVPATCCHTDSVINKKYTPICDGVFCTQECSGALDCGAGNIDCVENKCVIIPNN